MAAANKCPSCGTERPANAPEGYCPRCLLNLSTNTDAPGRGDVTTVPATMSSGPEPETLTGDSEATGAYIPGPVAADSKIVHGQAPKPNVSEATGTYIPGSAAHAASPPTAATGDWSTDSDDPQRTTDAHSPTRTADGHSKTQDLSRGAAVRYFGDYEILKELGRGGMGVVYKARQVSLNRPVALKMIKVGALADDADLRRFQNEAEAVALLDHPGIVPVYEVGEHEGQRYFSMKLIEGSNLGEQLASFQSNPRAAVALLIETAEAVQHAHMRGILHRDLKPANVLIDTQDHPHITDFGLAKLMESDVELTASGAIMGTPSYMSPEQAAGRRGAMTLATDVYGLGAIFYALLTGKAPFGGDSVIETLDAVRSRPPEAPRRRNAAIPRDLELICLKCLEKNPSDRYPTAAALADDLRRWAAGEPVSVREAGVVERVAKWARRKPTLAAAYTLGLLTVLLGGLGGAAVWQWRAAAGARDVAAKARDLEAEARASAEKARDGEATAREALARVEYGRTIEVAHQEWRDNRARATQALLDSTRPDLRGWEWRYVHRLRHSDLLTLRGATSQVSSAVFSPDGSTILTVDGEITIASGRKVQTSARIWDARTGTELLSLKAATASVISAVFSPDGSRIVSICDDNAARIWDARTGAELFTLQGHTGVLNSAAFSPDRSRVVTASDDSTARVWDAETGGTVLTFRGHASPVMSASFSPDGSRVVTAGGLDKTARVWDAKTGVEILKLDRHADFYVHSASFSPDGARIVTIDREVNNIAQLGRGPKAAAGVWDAKTGSLVFVINVSGDFVESASFSQDGVRIVTAGEDGTTRVWLAKTGAELLVLKGHTGLVHSAAFSPDGSRIVTASSIDNTARVWDAETGAEVLCLKGHINKMKSASFSPDGLRVVTVDGDGLLSPMGVEKTARVWDARTGAEVLAFRVSAVTWASFSPDGSRIVVCDPKTARVLDAKSGALVLTLKWPDWDPRSLPSGPMNSAEDCFASFSPDGSRIVTACNWDTTARVWDAQTGIEVLTLKGTPFVATTFSQLGSSASFSPDGSRIVTAGAGVDPITVWDARTGVVILKLKEFGALASFSPDGSRIVAMGGSSTTRVWDAKTGEVVLTYEGGNGVPSFSPDGLRIINSGGMTMTSEVWDAQTGVRVLTLKGHAGPVYSALYSPDGSRIVTASVDNTAKVWDAQTGVEVLTLKGHTSFVSSAFFSPDGSRIVTVSDSTIRIWDASPINRQVILANRLPAVLKGEDQPANNDDRLAFARMAYDTKRYAVATKLYAMALEADPKLGDDRKSQHPYNAACSAALAAAGQGQGEPPLDDAAKAKLRRQALSWLKSEFSAWKHVFGIKEAGNKEMVAKNLAHWKKDPKLASLRDEKELARLPEDERKEWRSFWADVEALIKTTGS